MAVPRKVKDYSQEITGMRSILEEKRSIGKLPVGIRRYACALPHSPY
jgi:hypothetical protein